MSTENPEGLDTRAFPPKTIATWINGGGVNTATLVRELREWADYFDQWEDTATLYCVDEGHWTGYECPTDCPGIWPAGQPHPDHTATPNDD
jgi:hypothetical protein